MNHATGERSLDLIQRRGRWAVASSVRRYEQEGRLQVILSRMPDEVLRFGFQCQAHIEELILRPVQLVRPPKPSLVLPPK